jgi:hypothetical protein
MYLKYDYKIVSRMIQSGRFFSSEKENVLNAASYSFATILMFRLN